MYGWDLHVHSMNVIILVDVGTVDPVRETYFLYCKIMNKKKSDKTQYLYFILHIHCCRNVAGVRSFSVSRCHGS